MRVLFVNPSSPPVPYGSGLQVHNWGNIQALQLLGHEIFLVMLSRYGEDYDEKINEANHANKELKLCTVIEVPERKVPSLNALKPGLILSELARLYLRKETYFVQNHTLICSELERIIVATKAEMIWYEDFYVAIYDNWLKREIPAIYNSHDNQARLYKQKIKNTNNYSNRLSSKIRRLIYASRYKGLVNSEFKTQKRCNVMFTGNRSDAELSKSHGVNAIARKVPIIGPSENILEKRRSYINNVSLHKDNKIKLLHLGALHGSFTARSLLWFLREEWQNFQRGIKDTNVELHVIGSGKPSKELLKQLDQPNIVYRGYVEDIWGELMNTFAMIIPGQVSTGIRIRVPVAFSLMVPIIGNRVSFHGMPDAIDGETVLYAENSVEYAHAVSKLMDNVDFYHSMCLNIRRVYEDNFSIKAASVDIQTAIP